MLDKHILKTWVLEALRRAGGRAALLEVGKDTWAHHEHDLRASGDLFYSWQYDYRWAATALRQSGKVKAADKSPTGTWELTETGARG